MIFSPFENESDGAGSGAPERNAAVACGIRLILFTIAVVLLGLVLWRLRDIALLCFGALIGALILRSLAAPLIHRLGLSDAASVALTIFVVLAVSGGFILFFGNQTAAEFGEFQRLIPASFDRLNNAINGSSIGRGLIDLIKHTAADTKTLTGMGTVAGGLVEVVTEVSLVVFLSIYFAFSPNIYINGFMRLVPKRHKPRVSEALDGATTDLKKWLLAQLYAMVIIGLLVGISCAILKIPLSLLLGVFAGLLEFIPVVGPVLFVVPAVLIAFTQGPATVVKVLIVYFAMQQLESNVITPLLQQKAVKLPPAVTLLAIVAGGLLLGPRGVIFGLPLTVVLISLGKRLTDSSAGSETVADFRTLKQF
ncbi:MAG: AI-2E family transporter [Nibricoccus sp.]